MMNPLFIELETIVDVTDIVTVNKQSLRSITKMKDIADACLIETSSMRCELARWKFIFTNHRYNCSQRRRFAIVSLQSTVDRFNKWSANDWELAKANNIYRQ